MTQAFDPPQLPPRKTLVIEDDRVSRMALTRILEMLGQEVHAAATVAEGFQKLGVEPQFVLLDLMLPDGDGIQILRRIREENMPMRVAVTTGLTDPLVMAQVMELKPDAIFHKPLHPPDIAQWLAR